jgi:hypothetical protein
LTSICIPGSVRALGKGCFAGRSDRLNRISLLTFDDSSVLEWIQESCFQYCSLKSICIPRSVAVLKKSCFLGSRVHKLVFEAGSRLTEIGEKCFCESSLESLRVPTSVRVLRSECFRDAKIRTMVLPCDSQLREFGTMCFRDCKFGSIMFEGDLDDIGKGNLPCTFCITGEAYFRQKFYTCKSCGFWEELGCCAVCAATCHRDGHDLVGPEDWNCFCDCGSSGGQGRWPPCRRLWKPEDVSGDKTDSPRSET